MADYETEYNNRARVPEHPAIIAGWAHDAAAYREAASCELGVSYGPSARQYYDLFRPTDMAARALAVFFHGGYWQALDPSFFSHMARGLNQRGVAVAVVGYNLCPVVTIADIIGETRYACAMLHQRFGLPLVCYGHSAGGHLAACMLATESQSPFFWPAPSRLSCDAVVGGEESEEYLRQSRRLVDVWGLEGVITRYEEIPGANHFTAIAPLADPASAMTARIAALCGA